MYLGDRFRPIGQFTSQFAVERLRQQAAQSGEQFAGVGIEPDGFRRGRGEILDLHRAGFEFILAGHDGDAEAAPVGIFQLLAELLGRRDRLRRRTRRGESERPAADNRAAARRRNRG